MGEGTKRVSQERGGMGVCETKRIGDGRGERVRESRQWERESERE